MTMTSPISAQTLAARKTRPANVAIVGLGLIAPHMAQTLKGMEKDPRYSSLVRAYAVATHNNVERAEQFARTWGFEKAYGSYEELFADPDVDIVYIATPHPFHEAEAVAALTAGKAVLVEKTFTGDAAQTRTVLETSRQSGNAAVEAIWTRFMPSCRRINEVLSSGIIGDIKEINATLSYNTTAKPRILDPALGGGSLLDVGVYGLNFIAMLTDDAHPERIVTSAGMTSTGVDAHSSTALYLPGGVLATMTCSCVAEDDRFGLVHGTKGYAVVTNINNPERLDIYDDQHRLVRSEALNLDQITGYEYEVVATVQAWRTGQIEAPQMPHSQTLRLMEQMDGIRDQWGLVYPFEK
jgi:predicted dehydrogenase